MNPTLQDIREYEDWLMAREEKEAYEEMIEERDRAVSDQWMKEGSR